MRERERKGKQEKRIQERNHGALWVYDVTGTHHHASQETMAHCLRRMEENGGKINTHIRSKQESIPPDANVKWKERIR